MARTWPVFDRADDVRSARTDVNLRAAVIEAGGERQATANHRRAVYGPAADQQISRSAHAAGVLLALAEWQIVYLGQDEHVVPVIIVGTIGDFSVDVVIVAVIVGGVLESVIRIEGQTGSEALLDCGLQRVVVIVGIVPEIVDALCPAIKRVIVPPLMAAEAAAVRVVAHHGWFIGSVGRTATSKGVRTLIADVSQR